MTRAQLDLLIEYIDAKFKFETAYSPYSADKWEARMLQALSELKESTERQ